MSLREDFFEDQKAGFPAYKSKPTFSTVWPKVLAYEEKTGKSLDSGLTREEYIELFRSMGIRHTMRLHNCKNAIRWYISYLIMHGALPKEQLQILKSVKINRIGTESERNDNGKLLYFRDMDMLRDAVLDALDTADCWDTDMYDDAVSALYLIWCGLTLEQISDIKKSDVLDDSVISADEKIVLPPFAIKQIQWYRDSTGFFVMKNRLSFFPYKTSDYLFRSVKKERMEATRIGRKLNVFNSIASGAYSFTYSVVHWSGVFNRACELERELGNTGTWNLKDRTFASKVFCEDLENNIQLHRARIHDYELYKRIFNQ